MKGKKSVAVNMLILLVLGAFIFLVLAIAYPKLIGKGNAEASTSLSETGDYDGDGITNYFDKCKCTPAGVASDTNDGCPTGTDYNVLNFCQYQNCKISAVPVWAKPNCPDSVLQP